MLYFLFAWTKRFQVKQEYILHKQLGSYFSKEKFTSTFPQLIYSPEYKTTLAIWKHLIDNFYDMDCEYNIEH